MNNSKTTIEVDALEWWDNKLNYVQCLQLINKYFPDEVGQINTNQIATIYTAEHHTAPTVEENNQSPKKIDDYIGDNKLLKDALEEMSKVVEMYLQNVEKHRDFKMSKGSTITHYFETALIKAKSTFEQTK